MMRDTAPKHPRGDGRASTGPPGIEVLFHTTSQREKQTMGRPAIVVPYVLTMVAVVVGVDVLFFRHHSWPRLLVNIGIVLVFGAFYLRFLKHP
jgi:protein-S-isoprenylcysteine O-methyltransferase Ste14